MYCLCCAVSRYCMLCRAVMLRVLYGWPHGNHTIHATRAALCCAAQGVVWVAERRATRFVLHLSGRRRAECVSDGPWDSPPMTQLVFIGSNRPALRVLARELCALSAAPVHVPGGPGTSLEAARRLVAADARLELAGRGEVPAQPSSSKEAAAHQPFSQEDKVADRSSSRLQEVGKQQPLSLDGHQEAAAHQPCSNQAAAKDDPSSNEGATVGKPTTYHPVDQEDAQAHTRLQPTQLPEHQTESQEPSGVLEFSVASAPLHGVRGPEVNALLMRAVNAHGGLFLCGLRQPGMISGSGMAQRGGDSVAALLLGVPAEGGAAAADTGIHERASRGSSNPQEDGQSAASQVVEGSWLELLQTALKVPAEPVLRRAFQHVHNCRCDIPFVKGS